MQNATPNNDYDYIIRIINFLETTHGISFFITTKDFDALYNWWEKRIPMTVIQQAIATVIERWTQKNKEIKGFSNFNYEVKKCFTAFLQLNVGTETKNEATKSEEDENIWAEFDNFLSTFPQALTPLRKDFHQLVEQLKKQYSEEGDKGIVVDPTSFYEKLVDLFRGDDQVELKVNIFKRSLAPELRKPEIENRYRLNLLLGKFNIPDFELI